MAFRDDNVRLLLRAADWRTGGPCARHQIQACPDCRPRAQPDVVYVPNGRGNDYHRSPRCPALHDEERRVGSHGVTSMPVVCVTHRAAEASGLQPCAICFPDVPA